jgi:hypothetical protein
MVDGVNLFYGIAIQNNKVGTFSRLQAAVKFAEAEKLRAVYGSGC